MLDTVMPVFMQMIVLFLILAVGYVAGKTKTLTIESNKTLSILVNCIANPCNILYSSLCVEHALDNAQVLQLLGIAFLIYMCLIAVSFVIVRLIRVPKPLQGQYNFMLVFSNLGYMGIPVIRSIYGEEAVMIVAIFVMVFYLFVYTYGIYLICGKGGSGFDWKKLLCPMTISAMAGIICYLCNVRVGGVAADAIHTISQITTPCAMLIIGCALSNVPFKTVFTNWRLYIVSALKLLVIPCIVFLCLRSFVTDTMLLGVVVVLMAMPIATNFTMLSAQYDRDQTLAAASIFMTTLLSVITIPILVGILNM